MQHNLNSGSGKSDAEIRAENATKYLGEVRMSGNLRWHDKLSPKKRREAFFWIGFFAGFVTCMLIDIAFMIIRMFV